MNKPEILHLYNWTETVIAKGMQLKVVQDCACEGDLHGLLYGLAFEKVKRLKAGDIVEVDSIYKN